MISWSDVNSLEKQRLDLQLKLNCLLNSSDSSIDDINGIRAEILHIDKQIKRIVGKNEIARQKKLKSDSSEAITKRNFDNLKGKYRRISNFTSAVATMNLFIISRQNKDNSFKSPVKVMK